MEASSKGNTFTWYSEGDSGMIFSQSILQICCLYLACNKLASHKAAIKRTETLAEIYLLLDSL